MKINSYDDIAHKILCVCVCVYAHKYRNKIRVTIRKSSREE